MQFYSILNNTWSTSAPLPRAMNHINAAVVDGRIYVLGGLADLGEAQPAWRGVGDAFVYSPRADTWTRLPSLPDGEARGSAAVGVYGSKIVLAGGMTDLELSGNRSQNTVAVVSVFDTESCGWETVSDAAKYLPEGRDHAAAAVVGSEMYVLGGREQGQENVKGTVFVLDLDDFDAGWTIGGARMPTPRGGVAAGVIGKKVYVLGGEGNANADSGVFGEVEVYDTRKDKWASLGSMRMPRHGTYAVGVGNKVYVPGGGVRQSGAPVADFDVFQPCVFEL
jgi:N-acetylneuraminic acid mutarotase